MQVSQTIASMDDRTLLKVANVLAKSERQCQVRMLELLAEIDERNLYSTEGYASLWDYCRRALQFSEGTSHRRVVVARAGRQFPEILEAIRDGRLTLCTASDLAPSLTKERSAELIAQASGKSRHEVQALVETKRSLSAERDVVRRLPKSDLPALTQSSNESVKSGNSEIEPSPVFPIRHRIAFTADESLTKKLDRLKVLLNATRLEVVIEKAADSALAVLDPERRHDRRRKKGRPSKAEVDESNPRRPSAAIIDAVKVRDGNRCTYVSRTGVRCTSDHYLEVDHIQPFSMGGSSTDPDNLRVLCKTHHALVTRRTFGSRLHKG